MPVLRPVKSHYFVQWFHSRYFRAAAGLECFSCENFWSADDFRRVLSEDTTQGYVLADLLTPFGFIVFTRADLEGRILNLVVHPDYRRDGWGTILVDRAKANLEEAGCDSIVVDVRESNLGAHLFLRDNGFQATGVSKDYFKDHYEDYIEKEDGFRFVWRKHE